LKILAELGLVVFFGGHAVQGIRLALQNKAARGAVGYRAQQTKGRPSRWNLASTRMPLTGLLILGFIILHLIHFRFGPAQAEGYTAVAGGQDVRDLYRLVVEVFSKPLAIAVYAGAAALMGLHLRHGIWSAFQSLGQMNRRATWPVYTAAAVIAAVLALGFIALPFYLCFTHAGA
jgi:succinate dehydrogenase / fumarate reductase cytochrome b subunit